MSVDRLLSRLNGVRQTGSYKWVSRCPAHEDRSPSLAIRECPDGRILLHCFAGCATDDILVAVGLSFSDLFPRPISHELASERRPFDPMQVLIAMAHEYLVVAIVAQDLANGADLSAENQDRLSVAVNRLQAGLSAIGDIPAAEDIKRIRRAEVSV